MKKRILSFLFAVIICLFSVLPAFAIIERPLHIFDESNIFTEEEFNELEADACAIEEKYGCTVMYCVTDSVGEGGTYEYCEALFKMQGDPENGILLIHNTGDRKYTFCVGKKSEPIFPEDVQDNVLWKAYNEPKSYFDSVKAYLDAVKKQLKAAGVSAPADSTTITVDPNLPQERLLPLVVDQANLLSDSEEKVLTERLEEISDRFELDLAVVTVTDFGGKTPEDFADDFYDYNGYGRGENADGALLVYKPGKQGDRRLQISTCGKAIDALTDAKIDSILNGIKDYFINEDYIGGFNAFADQCDDAFEIEFNPSVSPFWIPICLIIGFVIAFAITKIRTNSLKSVRKKVDASDYATGVAVTDRSDVFLYRNVSKTPIPKDTGSGGGSSTHTSSSGRSHGGGGASF
ncbi:MAG: TPM domain-containing protein [Oscillospiraceae bacterium]|nr:TPM domain-containing protein [Oscillospiraceae bacterium]